MPQAALLPPPGFGSLNKSEQIQYIQDLWDQISANPSEIPVRESHLALAEERLNRYRADPSAVRPAFEILDRIAAAKQP